MKEILPLLILVVISLVSALQKKQQRKHAQMQQPGEAPIIDQPKKSVAAQQHRPQRQPRPVQPEMRQEPQPMELAESRESQNPENAENRTNLPDFDLRSAIIYSEILKPKFDDKDF